MQISSISISNYFIGGSSLKNKNVNFKSKETITPEKREEISDLMVFSHHIYEYKKGLRNLILTTEKEKHREVIERRLERENIPYYITKISNNKINVYFGAPSCVEVAKTFDKHLNKLSPEQDFMLGIMLGYDRVKQCDRYLKFKQNQIKTIQAQE